MNEHILEWVRSVLIDEKRITDKEYLELWQAAVIEHGKGGLKGDISKKWVSMGFKDKLNDLYL